MKNIWAMVVDPSHSTGTARELLGASIAKLKLDLIDSDDSESKAFLAQGPLALTLAPLSLQTQKKAQELLEENSSLKSKIHELSEGRSRREFEIEEFLSSQKEQLQEQEEAEKHRKQRLLALANMNLAVEEIGRCLVDISIVLQQGIRPDNSAKRGGISAGLERAAYRVQHGSTDGFLPNPAKPAEVEKKPVDWELEKRNVKANHIALVDTPPNPECVTETHTLELPGLPINTGGYVAVEEGEVTDALSVPEKDSIPDNRTMTGFVPVAGYPIAPPATLDYMQLNMIVISPNNPGLGKGCVVEIRESDIHGGKIARVQWQNGSHIYFGRSDLAAAPAGGLNWIG